ncbi:saccharopine dehydrogenase [Streptacidiphilus sp. 4-A2]|nr:saccharopine dehydrogenase [Streptacidiphilus sp. 4-A2]
MGPQRRYDLVLFGATGFTGALTAGHLARNRPPGCRWALAGRDLGKLEALRARLAEELPDDPDLAKLPLLVADSGDRQALREVAAAARVVVSTVGPFLTHGEPLVAACAEEGTDYLDLTGEPEFVDLMYLRHHQRAVATGARLVHCGGFDSVPHDLGVLFTVGRLPDAADSPVRVEGFLRGSGAPSGGTLASVLAAFARPLGMAQAARRRRAADPAPAGRRIRLGVGLPRWSRTAHAWVLPLPTVDPQVVARSAAALPGYGPDFHYTHHVAVKRLPAAAALVLGTAVLAAAAPVPPLRRVLERLRPAGEGPDAAKRARSWFTVRFVGVSRGHRVVTEVSGGDPGYGETSVMLGESALCLAFDELPRTAGQVTTAAALGPALIDRLTAAGLRFTVLDRPPTAAPGPVGRPAGVTG